MELILYLLTRFKYYFLFPLAIIEGPILSVISGFLSSTGFLNPFIAVFVIIAGDIVGDSLYYFLGRQSNKPFLQKIIGWLGLTDEKAASVKEYIDANPLKTISLSKVILGVGVTGLFLAGKSKFPYLRFLVICIFVSSFTCAVYFSIGFFFGKAYEQINQYLNYFASFTIVAAVAAALLYMIRTKFRKKKL